jgi:hypothetical protein
VKSGLQSVWLLLPRQQPPWLPRGKTFGETKIQTNLSPSIIIIYTQEKNQNKGIYEYYQLEWYIHVQEGRVHGSTLEGGC